MKRWHSASLPSAGFWLVVSSWAAVVAFLAWAGREPRLDRMKRELDRLATSDHGTASAELVRELDREMTHRPDLIAELTGETGARPIEASQDGVTRSGRFHVAIGPRTAALELRAERASRVELSSGTERLVVDVPGGRFERIALPRAWRGQGRLVDAQRSGSDVAVSIRGLEEAGR